ncbi:MAG: Ig-like domain-containing protein, partial [Defluviitaleaceae bacterium]|nr:Ig-like domain-containing protein [Defluviitaleaceae bacterium]
IVPANRAEICPSLWLDETPGIIEVVLDGAHKNFPFNDGRTNRSEIISAAIRQAAADGFDFRLFDKNGDGIISPSELTVGVIVDGFEGAGWSALGPSFWGSAGYWTSIEEPYHIGISRAFGQGSFQGNSGDLRHDLLTVGIIAHETAHSAYNFIDTYDYGHHGLTSENNSAGHGKWSLMAQGSWGARTHERNGTTPSFPDAYNLVTSGFVVPREAKPNEVSQTENHADIFKINTLLPTQFFLLQQRKNFSFDENIFFYEFGREDSGGMLIFHVDTDASGAPGRPFDNPSHFRAAIVEAHGGEQNLRARRDLHDGANDGDFGDLWGNSAHDFNRETDPSSNLFGAYTPDLIAPAQVAPSGVSISQIFFADGITRFVKKTDIVASHSSVDFGEVSEGYDDFSPITITITNTSGGTLKLNPITQNENFFIVAHENFETEFSHGEERKFSIRPMSGLSYGNFSATISVTGSGGAFAQVRADFSVALSPQMIAGTMHAEGAFMTLIDLESGERTATTTNFRGEYFFRDVPNGNYRLVFTQKNRAAKISDAIFVDGDGHRHDAENFFEGSGSRVLFARLHGLPNQNPHGTNVFIRENFLRNLHAPSINSNDNFWFIFSDEQNDDARGGIGTAVASSPNFFGALARVDEENYENNIAIVNLFLISQDEKIFCENSLRGAFAGTANRPTIIDIANDIVLRDGTLTVPFGANISLRSSELHAISANGNFSAITMEPTSRFSVEGVKITRNENSQGTGILNRGGILFFRGGIISRHTNSGVINIDAFDFIPHAVHYPAEFFMTGGEISNNFSSTGRGGGVFTNATFTMTGGKISDNHATQMGGGIGIPYEILRIPDRLFVGENTIFSNNSAMYGAHRLPETDAIYRAQIFSTQWTDPFAQGFNNYDIEFPSDLHAPYREIFFEKNFSHDENILQNKILAHNDDFFSSEKNNDAQKFSIRAFVNTPIIHAPLFPKNPTRDGDVFLGWYFDENFSRQLSPETLMPDENISLFALWQSNFVALESISIDGGDFDLMTDDEKQLTVNFVPRDATLRSVRWASSDEQTVTVDQNGLVFAHRSGAAQITVTTACGNFSASVTAAIAQAESVFVSSEAELRAAIDSSVDAWKIIFLAQNIFSDATIFIPRNANISLRSARDEIFSLHANGAFNVIEISAGARLTLENVKITREPNHTVTRDSNHSGILIRGGGHLTMLDGIITGHASGGVQNMQSGTFVMRGGEIYDNRATFTLGGGVTNNGDFTMHDGKIFSNRTESVDGGGNGGGVLNGLFGKFFMHGGKIFDNSANGANGGGGVLNQNIFEMHGGEISGIREINGGGIEISLTLLRTPGRLFIGENAIFADNQTVNSGRHRETRDDEIYRAQIFATQWTDPFVQGFNNRDIDYRTNTAVTVREIFFETGKKINAIVREPIFSAPLFPKNPTPDGDFLEWFFDENFSQPLTQFSMMPGENIFVFSRRRLRLGAIIDGENVTSADAAFLARHIAGHDGFELCDEKKIRADLNGDGIICADDLKILVRWLVGYPLPR